MIDINNLEKYTAEEIHKVQDTMTWSEIFKALIEIVYNIGNPFEILENDLSTLKDLDMKENEIEVMAIIFIYTTIFCNKDNIKEMEDELGLYELFNKSSLAQKREDIRITVQHEIDNLKARLNLDLLSIAIGITDVLSPKISRRKKSIFISTILKELGIENQQPFFDMSDAERDSRRVYSNASEIIYGRIKKYYKKFDDKIAPYL